MSKETTGYPFLKKGIEWKTWERTFKSWLKQRGKVKAWDVNNKPAMAVIVPKQIGKRATLFESIHGTPLGRKV